MLHVCAEYGQETLFKYFLNEGKADITKKNFIEETPLHLAAREGKFPLI